MTTKGLANPDDQDRLSLKLYAFCKLDLKLELRTEMKELEKREQVLLQFNLSTSRFESRFQ